MRQVVRILLQSLLLSAAALALPVLASDASVAARLDAQGIQYTIDRDGDYRVVYNYAQDNRTQLLFVSGRTESVGHFTIRDIFSPAGLVERDGLEVKALELLTASSMNKLGSWEVRGDVLYFVIKLPDDVDAAALEQAMDIAAETADDMEIELSGDLDEL
ncbi:MAG: hypothetical protein NVV60_03865 [Luteimonas sp.]|nr:hypothetical protein [Luteimonas sp.]